MIFDQLDKMVRYHGGMNRHLFLSYTAALSSIPWIGLKSGSAQEKLTSFAKDPFSLGVASGDPDHEGMVLWTKLAPEPLELDSGMPQNAYAEVTWEIAKDEQMQQILQSGTALATPELGHSVHVEVSGLQPNSWYWYRFRIGSMVSPIGKTRTMPREDELVSKLRFAVTSCQNFEHGLYTAYEQMSKDQPDLVCHLGDYIYEYKGNDKRIRTHLGPEIETLEHYRRRYAQYKSDPLLQKMHATCPWIVTWDDHEFDNNCAGDISEEKNVDRVAYLKRRAAAYQAYYEMMPLRKTSIPTGPDMQLYRRLHFGSLANFLVLDTRQYRTDQPNNDGKKPLNREALNPNNSLLGKTQKSWLFGSLNQSSAQWNVLTQQVMMGMVNTQREANQEAVYSMDQWPGYAAEKMEIMKYLGQHQIKNPIVLTGDIHCNWVNELRVDDFKPETKRLAVEFVATSLSSGGNGREAQSTFEKYQSNNACVKFYNEERGYILCEVTPKTWTSHYKVVDEILKPGGSTSIRASYVVNSGESVAHKI